MKITFGRICTGMLSLVAVFLLALCLLSTQTNRWVYIFQAHVLGKGVGNGDWKRIDPPGNYVGLWSDWELFGDHLRLRKYSSEGQLVRDVDTSNNFQSVVRDYTAGELSSVSIFHYNRQLRQTTRIEKGFPVGNVKTFDNEGRLQSEFYYHDGVVVLKRQFNRKGQLSHIIEEPLKKYHRMERLPFTSLQYDHSGVLIQIRHDGKVVFDSEKKIDLGHVIPKADSSYMPKEPTYTGKRFSTSGMRDERREFYFVNGRVVKETVISEGIEKVIYDTENDIDLRPENDIPKSPVPFK